MFTAALIACLTASAPAPQIRGVDLLRSLSSTLKEAKTLKAEFMYGDVDDIQRKYKIFYRKPAMARIESDRVLFLADGKTLLLYNKVTNTFWREPQTQTAFKEYMTSPEVTSFAAFFFPEVFANVHDTIYSGQSKYGEKTLEGVKFSFGQEAEAVLYTDPSDKLVYQGEFKVTVLGEPRQYVMRASSLQIDAPAPADVASFNPRSGFREIPPNTDIWYSTLDEAKKAAAATGRLVMAVFGANWDSSSRLLNDEVFAFNAFKQTGSKFAFVSIHVDKQPKLAEAYGVTTVPTLVFMRPDGHMVHKVSGRVRLQQLLQQMQVALSRR